MENVTPIETVAANVRREMQARGWSQIDLSDRSGVPQSRISELLAGKRDQKLTRLEKIANAFGVTISALVMPVAENGSANSFEKASGLS